jgi:hypothetical protein
MFQYRQVLVRLRQGDSDRDIARSRLMGPPQGGRFPRARRYARLVGRAVRAARRCDAERRPGASAPSPQHDLHCTISSYWDHLVS